MITAIAVAVIVGLALALVVAVALDRGPTPADVAIAYELARDRRDAETLWGLSAATLRSGRRRQAFVTETLAELADMPRDAVREVVVEDEYTGSSDASVLTRVCSRDGSTSQHRTRCVQEQGSWRVSAVTVARDPGATSLP